VKRTIPAKVIGIENGDGETPRVLLQGITGEIIAPKATVMTSAILRDQEPLIVATDRINIVGKGRPSVHLGDTVEVQIVSNPPSQVSQFD
jgi:hypothetical protein